MDYKKEKKELKDLSEAYYKGEPLISDAEFDIRLQAVREYEAANNVRSTVTTEILDGHTDGFVKGKHLSPMYSMKDVFDIDEMTRWFSKTIAREYTVEPKFDGLSLNLIYENGELKKAITRGDGAIGDNVTANAKVIRNIPKTIPHKDVIEIRGEVMMSKTTIKEINSKRKIDGDKLLSNTRNAAAGALKNKSSVISASRRLEFFPWGVGSTRIRFKSQTEIMTFLGKQGFDKQFFGFLVKSPSELLKLYHRISEDRSKLDYDIDGLAIKVNDVETCDKLGVVDKYPKYTMAFKFPHDIHETIVSSIVYQVGKTGAITPVALVNPVEIAGVTVSRCTLHNRAEINRLDLRIGDTVEIIRSGEVIPKIISVIKSKRPKGIKRVVFPTSCPVCESELVDDCCVNADCPDIIKYKLLHFVSRERFNISGMGERVIESLVMTGSLRVYCDIFKLTKSDLIKANISAPDKLLSTIARAKSVTLDRFIASIGIPNVGLRAGKTIANRFGLNFLSASLADLSSTKGIGDSMAHDFVSYINVNKENVMKLMSVVDINIPEEESDELRNYIFVISGSMPISRTELKAMIEAKGGTVASSVTKNTSLLIYGEGAGSKLTKAQSLGIALLDASDMAGDQVIEAIVDVSDAPF